MDMKPDNTLLLAVLYCVILTVIIFLSAILAWYF